MFCSKCGNQMNDNDMFCSSCGHQIGVVGYDINNEVKDKEIVGDFLNVISKIPLRLEKNEVLIEQCSAAFVMSSIAQGIFSLTNKRIIFTKDSAGKAFLKRGGLLGMALHSGAKIPDEITFDEIKTIEPTSCFQGKAAMLITITSGFQYKIALQSMALGKDKMLCEIRDRVVSLVRSVL